MPYLRNEHLNTPMLPVDIVLHPSWWHRHEGITFDEDFFFHPARRVEAERQMERVLFERWGRYGLGAHHDRDLPQIGPVHLAAGYIIAAMLGCRIEFLEDASPPVIPANIERLEVSREAPFASDGFPALRGPGRVVEEPLRLRNGRHRLGRAAQYGVGPARTGVSHGHDRRARRGRAFRRRPGRGHRAFRSAHGPDDRARPRSASTATCGTFRRPSTCTASART